MIAEASPLIADWKKLIGAENVISYSKDLKEASQAAFKIDRNILAIIRPASTKEVQACVGFAQQHQIPIYPISKGKNWGLGSKLPSKDSCVLMDLSRMDKIVDFDSELAFIRVQPGVTFQQVFDFLTAQNAPLMLDGIGSTPEASIIGNTMERGHGLAMYADRFNHVCGLQVVLPNGKILNTGFESFPHSKVGRLSKWGTGPYIDGLFTQSNLGITTEMTLWLKPKPQSFQTFILHINDVERLGKATNILRNLRLQGLQASFRIFNDYRYIAFNTQYPWKWMKEQTPLTFEAKTELKSQMGLKEIGNWIGFGGLYSWDNEIAQLERKKLHTLLAPYCDKLEFFYEENIQAMLEEKGEAFAPMADLFYRKSSLQGFPNDGAIKMCYWRKRIPVPQTPDPIKDQCGVLWYSPCIPNRAQDVLNCIDIIERICFQYGFEPNMGFLSITERALDVTGAICYDRTLNGADEQAMQCHNALLEAFDKAGYPLYRLGLQSMDAIKQKEQSHLQFAKLLKEHIDPNNILSPNRYIF